MTVLGDRAGRIVGRFPCFRAIGVAVATVLATVLGFAASASADLRLDPSFGTGGVQKLDKNLAPLDFGTVSAMSSYDRGVLFDASDLWRLGPDGAFDSGYGAEYGTSEWHISGFGRYTEDMDHFSDGSLAVAGYFRSFGGGRMGDEVFPYFAKVNPQGLPDLSFGSKGLIIPGPRRVQYFRGSAFRAVEIDSKDRIVVGGKKGRNGWLRIDRYHANGQPDENFGEGGRVYFKNPSPNLGATVQDLKILPDDRVLVTGSFKGRFFVLRLKTNGTIDRSFGKRGWVGGPKFGVRYTCNDGFCGGTQLELSPNGSITVTGSAFRSATDRWPNILVRLTADGSPARGFGRNGIARLDRARMKKLIPEMKSSPYSPAGRGFGGIAPLRNGRTFMLITSQAIPGKRHAVNRGRIYDAAFGLIIDRRGHIDRYQEDQGRPKNVFFSWLYFDNTSLGVSVEPVRPGEFFMSGWTTTPEILNAHPRKSVPSMFKMSED
jgi:uncharacterized delta-60 repeat protein